MAEQDRSRWDHAAIAEGARLAAEAMRGPRLGRFAAQAAIAAVHATASDYAETDWRLLVARYDDLLRVWPSPVVELNRAVAVAMAQGPDAGLAEIARIEADGRLAGYRYLPAAKADLLRRAGRSAEAAASYRAALELTQNEAERAFLTAAMADATRD
jgi:RNA polymerase sigma-70 factor (ECF subfamily)